MTTLNQARAILYNCFVNGWKNEAGTQLTPYCFDNETFDPPKDADGRPLPWARFSVRSIAGGQSTLGAPGNRKYKRSAIARVEVYGIPGAGLKFIDELLSVAADLFEGVQINGVKMHDATIAEIGLVDDGLWFLSTASTSLEYEQIK